MSNTTQVLGKFALAIGSFANMALASGVGTTQTAQKPASPNETAIVEEIAKPDKVAPIQGTFLVAGGDLSKSKVFENIVITGYSSTPDQTDDTPFITASGKMVRQGIVAANWLPLGTKVKIHIPNLKEMLPEMNDEMIFVVEDRMHPRNGEKMDIWFPTREAAVKFGLRVANVEIVK